MKMDIAFGQYCEGNSILHRLDPRAKLIISIIYIVVLFLAKNVFTFALLTLTTVALVLLSGISLRVIAGGLKPILFIALFTAIINIFFFTGDTLLVDLRIVKIYLEGLINAGLIVLRIVLLIVSTSMFLTYTTTPLALTDGMERLLAPLSKVGVPVHDFSMMMTIALRFIPTLIEETGKIMNAQKARGADFTSGGLVKRARAIIPIIIPLFVSAFRRAGDLATAMECRCYTGGAGRTRMNVLRAKWYDAAFVVLVTALGAAVVLMNIYLPGYSVTM
ncbi:MAG: energy-coupling factor transporter transmembrane protein EcfT [Clostridia bacterium]|nr:energy-coupling factor transporter transmembrane protein EcfT [Clostridia bacterium]MBR5633464.1 energy-coupling factor transporter transmembrane protein EcfT [Clostridia bacterium]